MAGFQMITIVGNLGKTPEVRYTQSGMAICTISVAVGERKKEGEAWVDHTEWFRVVTFGKTAENVGQYLDKGSKIHVAGKIRQREYKDKEGVERRTTELVADGVTFLDGKKDGEGGGRGGGGGRNQGGGGSRGGGRNDRRDEGPRDDRGDAGGGGEGGGDGGFIDDDLPFDLAERGFSW